MEVVVKYNHSLKTTHRIMRSLLWSLMNIWLMYRSISKRYIGVGTPIIKSNSHTLVIRTNLSTQITNIYQASWIKTPSQLSYVTRY
jgi:hypothetical protein